MSILSFSTNSRALPALLNLSHIPLKFEALAMQNLVLETNKLFGKGAIEFMLDHSLLLQPTFPGGKKGWRIASVKTCPR